MSGLDPVIHPPARLQLCGILAQVDDVEFAFAKARLGVSDSVLSKHAKALEDAGYLTIAKRTVSARQRTWLALTAQGRRAFRAHMVELQRLAAGVVHS
ncbi:transcriptional regulator [Microbacterium murale]|uniref:MarR family transcriptional regulator n=1 Tax=Microbacterium murale TaxID=1081040 RepID=A0ABQ1RRC0_9MICO|nr:transcriptional regulator [Microbacterium murale]GGD78977.1 MarR family transcriptional regulator [Microbacterium murale]